MQKVEKFTAEINLFLNNLELDAKQLWLAEGNHSKLKKIADNNWKKLNKTYN